jgi:hypothetical protein
MSWSGSHQGSYAIPPNNDFPPDHHIRQGQDVYFDPSLQPCDPHSRPFDRPLSENDAFGYPYDGGVVDSNDSQPIDIPGYPFVNGQ